jgi:hypothetical protein
MPIFVELLWPSCTPVPLSFRPGSFAAPTPLPLVRRRWSTHGPQNRKWHCGRSFWVSSSVRSRGQSIDRPINLHFSHPSASGKLAGIRIIPPLPSPPPPNPALRPSHHSSARTHIALLSSSLSGTLEIVKVSGRRCKILLTGDCSSAVFSASSGAGHGPPRGISRIRQEDPGGAGIIAATAVSPVSMILRLRGGMEGDKEYSGDTHAAGDEAVNASSSMDLLARGGGDEVIEDEEIRRFIEDNQDVQEVIVEVCLEPGNANLMHLEPSNFLPCHHLMLEAACCPRPQPWNLLRSQIHPGFRKSWHQYGGATRRSCCRLQMGVGAWMRP